MPITVTDTDGGRGNILRGWGSLSEQEIVKAHADHFGQPTDKFAAYRYGLSDFSEVTSIEISSDGVREISEMCVHAARAKADPSVAIVGSKDLVYGLARMLQAFAQDARWEISVFRTRSDAVAWIRERMRERFGLDVLKDDELEAVVSS